MRKICFFTGARSEYYLLRPLMQAIIEDPDLVLQTIVSGSHLSPGHGYTVDNIESDNIAIDERVEMLLHSDSPVGLCKSAGLGLIGFSEALSRLSPDMLVILGDRFETFSVASAACMMNMFIAHIHGGELTEGALDDSLRHAITKMSHLHFVSTEVYRKRVIQLGEQPGSVILSGAIGLADMDKKEFMPQEALKKEFGFSFASPCFLITFHPETRQCDAGIKQLEALLQALDDLGTVNILFTGVNADTGGQEISERIQKFAKSHVSSVHCVTNMGQLGYFSAMRYVDAVVGNSSSAIIEAPSFGVPVVNIGDRQKGRVQAANILNTEPERGAIRQACQKALTKEFKAQSRQVINPYFQPDPVKIIKEALHRVDTKGIQKSFYDIQYELVS